MKEYTQKLIEGILLIKKAVGANIAIIGIEDNKADAAAVLNDYIGQNGIKNIRIEILKSKYPQGSDKQLIYSLTGKKIAKGKRSSSYGIIVTNIHTAFSVFLAVKEGIQSYSRVITVTGGGVNNPKNLFVPTGALFSDIIDYCGGINESNPVYKLIKGGPMMGTAIFSADTAVTKTTNCILLLTHDESFDVKSAQCINCGKCARACPMRLMPMYIKSYGQAGNYDEAVRYGLHYCIECGCCAYVCPAKLPLVQSFRLTKLKLKKRGGQ